MQQVLKTMLENVRAKTPLVHNITNYVTVNDCANIVLACGASPIMADDAAEVEGITASDEDIEAEFKSLAERYELEVDKVKEMVPMDELTGSIKTRKAIKVIVDSAVPVAPKAEEKTEE